MNWENNILVWDKLPRQDIVLNCMECIGMALVQPEQPVLRFEVECGANPLVYLWRNKKSPVVGVIEARWWRGGICVEMMAVRPKFRRQGVNTSMMNVLRGLTNGKIVFDNPTIQGSRFIKAWRAGKNTYET